MPLKPELIAAAAKRENLPALLLDLEAWDQNLARFLGIAKSGGKTIRLATKSIRVPDLLKRAFAAPGAHETLKGLLCYSVAEAVFLHKIGFRDLVVAYPCMEERELWQAGALLKVDPQAITFMVDLPAHWEILDRALAKSGYTGSVQLALDVDASWRPGFGPWQPHVGVRRSSLHSADDVARVLDALSGSKRFSVVGLMMYEAQIAGLGDASPFAPSQNPIKRWIKGRSQSELLRRRAKVVEAARARAPSLAWVNGGGTGSLAWSASDPSLTELSAGSGLFQSHLFDYYRDGHGEPALHLALRVTRQPTNGVIACQSGGVVASGEPGWDRLPVAEFPEGLSPIPSEGYGEVQTPFTVQGSGSPAPVVGDVVLARTAKAGEATELFDEVVAVTAVKLLGGVASSTGPKKTQMPTYRGLGLRFR